MFIILVIQQIFIEWNVYSSLCARCLRSRTRQEKGKWSLHHGISVAEEERVDRSLGDGLWRPLSTEMGGHTSDFQPSPKLLTGFEEAYDHTHRSVDNGQWTRNAQ